MILGEKQIRIKGGEMMYKIVVPGRPVPAARMTQKNKWVSARAQRSLAYQQTIAWYAKAAQIPVLEGLLSLTVKIYVFGKKHGDLSNYIKAVEDGLQYAGVIPNDKQIVRYGEGTGIYYVDDKGKEKMEIEIEKVS